MTRIREVHIQNFSSIAGTVLTLGDLTVLVGPNGSGKTNVVNALTFVATCMQQSLAGTVLDFGGMEAVRHKQSGPRGHVGFRLILDLAPDRTADYSFEFTTDAERFPTVVWERCAVSGEDGVEFEFAVEDGRLEGDLMGVQPRLTSGRLALPAVSAAAEYADLFDALAGIGAYRIDPQAVARPMITEPAKLLYEDGRNAAAILVRVQKEHPQSFDRIQAILRRVLPDLVRVETVKSGTYEFVQFTLRDSQLFPGAWMSEGTLRLLGLLLAVYQPDPPQVLTIEEPERSIHPAAAEMVASVLMDAAKHVQVVVTTHSPDILDHKALADDSLRLVTREHGATVVAPVGQASRDAIRQRLYSPGELLRVDELSPDVTQPVAVELFGTPATPLGVAA